MRYEGLSALLASLVAAALLAGCAAQPPVTVAEPRLTRERPVEVPEARPVKPPMEKAAEVIDNQLNVFFSKASSTVSDSEKEKLRAHAERLKSDSHQKVTLLGHTDDLGSPSYNIALTDMRVSAVIRVLKAYGVSTVQIARQLVGREHRPATCKTESCLQKYRRVELIYSSR